MDDKLVEVISAVQARRSIEPPPNSSTIHLISFKTFGEADIPSIRRFQKTIADKLGIRITVLGGGYGCTRIIFSVTTDSETAKVISQQLLSSAIFRQAALEVDFSIAGMPEPYVRVDLRSGKVEGAMPSTFQKPTYRAEGRYVDKIRVLFLAANPQEINVPLRLDEEVRSIAEALRDGPNRDRFELHTCLAVRVADLQVHLLRHRPDIVHFSGHGSESNEIVLEDNSGDSRTVPRDALTGLFSVLKDKIRCVILNACYSEPQALDIAKNIDCVIGMSHEIEDRAAICFASKFYLTIGYGWGVKMAFDVGCNQIALEGLNQATTPKLFAIKVNPVDVTFI